MAELSLTRILAEFIADFSYEHLSDDDVDLMQCFFLDWLGCTYGGSHESATCYAMTMSQVFGADGAVDILPSKDTGPPTLAALINGVASHVLEMDDLHREAIIHTAAPTIPAVLAAAQQRRVSGREMLAALVVAFEVHIRIALAVGPSHYYYWHTTGTCGTFGAAAGVGKVLRLDPLHLQWALGTAGTTAAGLWEFLSDSAMSKVLHPGKAALNGLLAAYLAEQGFTGTERILEGTKGFFMAMSDSSDPSRITKDLGEKYHWRQNSLKHHASCGHTHSTLDAALDATGYKAMHPDEIERIDVRIYQDALDLLGKVDATDPYLAKFSLQYCLAAAVTRGTVSSELFSSSSLHDPDIRALMPRICISPDPTLSKRYPRQWPARVNIILKNGELLQGAADHPKGDPENPLSRAEIVAKFKTLTADILHPEQADTIIENVFALHETDDMSLFFRAAITEALPHKKAKGERSID